METMIRLVLEDWEGAAVDVRPAHSELNPHYRLAVKRHIAPHEFAHAIGRISEERANEMWAQVYAESVILGSPDPELGELDEDGWKAWLLEDLERFLQIRRYAMAEENFPDADEGFRARLG